MDNILRRKIAQLYSEHGPQGWWPRLILEDYQVTVKHHPGPENTWELSDPIEQIWEVMVGSILTQNTKWGNVERTIVNLFEAELIHPKKILQASEQRIQQAIRPSGYYVQKAKKLMIAAEWFLKQDWNDLKKKSIDEQRSEIFSLWGVGPETGDTILLYGLKTPSFVIDTYTRRLFVSLLNDPNWLTCPYDMIKSECERAFQNIPQNQPDIVNWWQEIHALIVQWGKLH